MRDRERERAVTPFPLLHSDERRNLFSFRVSEGNTLLDLIDRIHDQLPSRISMPAFVLRDAIQMSLSPFKRVERAFHVRLGSDRNTNTETHCGSDEGDRQHFSGGLVEKAHASFL